MAVKERGEMLDWYTQLETFDRFLVLLTLVVIIVIFYRISKSTSEPRPKQGRPLLGCLVMLILLSITSIGGSYWLLGHLYQKFTEEKLIATISCRPPRTDAVDFELTITLQSGPNKGKSQTLGIRGEQWAVGGHVLKWNPFLNALGLKSMYKLTSIEGRFPGSLPSPDHMPSVYLLTNEVDSGFWKFFYKNAHYIPFVSSVYGNLIYNYPSFNRDFNIYVTTTGFFPRLAERNPSNDAEMNRDRPMR